MEQVSVVGLDLAKSVFQVHGVNAQGEAVLRRKLSRGQLLKLFEKLPPCLIGMEACASAHHWARELAALGHEVKLMPPQYVKPYVKRGKNDAADAEAICEAVTRQTMRFVPIKSREQQAALSIHRARSLLIKQRTQLVNMMRSVIAELGIAIPVGIEKALQMARKIVDGEAELDLPDEAQNVIVVLAEQMLQLHAQLRKLDLRLAALQRSDERARRLATIPGIGPVGATALSASVGDPAQFKSGRQFAAFLGLTPRQRSSGGKERLGRITKMGDAYLRQLLVVGATSLIRSARSKPETVDPRFVALVARKPARVASVAIANKMARIAWAIMARGGVFECGHAPILAA